MATWILVGLAIGAVVGYFIRKVQIAGKVNSIEARVARAEDEAKNKEKEIILEAKSKALEIVESAKKNEQDFRNQIIKVEERITKKETDLERRMTEVENMKQEIGKKRDELLKTQDEMRELKQKQLDQLQKIAALSTDEAKKLVMDNAEKTMREELAGLTRKLIVNARDEADKKAREIVSLAIQRCASEVTSEMTTTAVQLPSEEMKGRIIGKEGRNIRT